MNAARSLAIGAAAAVAVGMLGVCGRGGSPATTMSTAGPLAATVATPTTGQPPVTTTSISSTAFEGEGMTPQQAARLQQAVDEGHQPWRLDVNQVADAFVRARFGWTDVDSRLTDPHTAEVTDRATGERVTLQLRQPVQEGATGIWVVIGGNRLN